MSCRLWERIVQSSVADPERFDADPDPDPTFQADADPNPFTRVRNFFFLKSSTIVSIVMCNFSARMREEG